MAGGMADSTRYKNTLDFLDRMVAARPDFRVVVTGFSFGGAVALQLARDRGVSAVVFNPSAMPAGDDAGVLGAAWRIGMQPNALRDYRALALLSFLRVTLDPATPKMEVHCILGDALCAPYFLPDSKYKAFAYPYWDRDAQPPRFRADHDAHNNFKLFLAQPVDAEPREFPFPEQSALKALRSETLTAAKVDRLLFAPAEALLESMRRGAAPDNDDIYLKPRTDV